MADVVAPEGHRDGLFAIRRPLPIDWSVWIPGSVLVLLIAACFLGPQIFSLPGPNVVNLSVPHVGIGAPGHLFGTDELGRDLLSRSLYGGQTSFVVGLSSVAIGLGLGGLLGLVSGFMGGWIDSVIMRLLDILLAFPSLILALTVATYLGPSERNVIFAIAFFTVPSYARVARSGTIQFKEREFLLAGELSGAGRLHLIFRHVLPNIWGRLMTYGILTMPVAMIVEASLSFLGLGIRPPQSSWGAMIADGKAYLTLAPQISLVPAAFLFVAVTSLNMLGDGIRARYSGRESW